MFITSMSAPAAQRTELLDALRGFALFGVAWSNYAMFAFWIFMQPADQAKLTGSFLDAPLEFLHSVLIDGKFYSIFSLLFGIGFGFFLEKGPDGLLRFYRRMLILLGIGWLHMRYLWEGDILFLYAALGMLLPLFRWLGDRALIVVATVLVLSPIAIDSVKVLSDGALDPSARLRISAEASDAELGVPLEQINAMVPNGGLREFVAYQRGGWLWRMEYLLGSNRLPKVMGLFLLGLWVSRKKLFTDPGTHRRLFRMVLFIGSSVGLVACLFGWWTEAHTDHLPHPQGLLRTVAYAFGVVPLALAYASGFALLWMDDCWRGRLSILAPMGRMALTNYLMQTMIALALFTGMGLGWGTRVSAIGFESIALAVFIMQVMWSRWWLARFRFGPMEWAWRSLTYGKVMRMRK